MYRISNNTKNNKKVRWVLLEQLPTILSPKILILIFLYAMAFTLLLLGGEPFEPQNQKDIVELLRQIKGAMPDKSIWAFSGYLFDRDILSGRLGDWDVTQEYLSYLDVLVDGPFVEEKKNLSLRFRGSENQRLIDVPASLAAGQVVLWQDWQGDGRGMK